MKTIVKMIFGSHLYGTNTPESDTDYKGIFLPSKREIYLNKIPKSVNFNTKKESNVKNSNMDIDTEIYSLHYFLELACQGQTVALDMLHCPKELLIESSETWKMIVSERHRFYTKNLDAFVGYARKQAAKYGIKGSRLNDAKRILDFLDDKCNGNLTADISLKIKDVWDELPSGEFIIKHQPDVNGIRMLEVCGRKIGETAYLYYAYNIVKKFYDNYGERAEKAAKNEGIDWKAVSHALRAAFQVRDILITGTISYPLKESAFLKKVKAGNLDYLTEVNPYLDKLMNEVECLSKESTYPLKVDVSFWNTFLINVIEKVLI